MINWFLKAKHWHLFILMIGIPMIAQIAIFMLMMLDAYNGSSSMSEGGKLFMIIFPIILLLFAFFHFGWFYSISFGLQKYIPEGVKMKVKKFKIFFWIPMGYIVLISLLIGVSFLGIQFDDNTGEASLSVIFSAMAFIIPLHLFSMFCIFYTLYFTAKTYKTALLQREVSFGDFAGEFFLFWFYFIGIWIIQPKINKMVLDS